MAVWGAFLPLTAHDASGYDPDLFVQKVSDDCICAICLMVMRDPSLVVACGHHFCETCIKTERRAGRDCPLCRRSLKKIVPNKEKERFINGRTVRCENNSKGCKWSGNVKGLEDHKRKKACFLPCSEGCNEKMMLAEMEDHIISNCPETVVSCPFKSVGEGCLFKEKRRLMEEHVTSNLYKHLLLSASACREMQEYIWTEHTQKAAAESRETSFDWVISNFREKHQQETWSWMKACQESEDFYFGPCKSGYALQMEAYLNGWGDKHKKFVSVCIYFVKGKNDEMLEWPVPTANHFLQLQLIHSRYGDVVKGIDIPLYRFVDIRRQKPANRKLGRAGIHFIALSDLESEAAVLSTNRLHLRCVARW